MASRSGSCGRRPTIASSCPSTTPGPARPSRSRSSRPSRRSRSSSTPSRTRPTAASSPRPSPWSPEPGAPPGRGYDQAVVSGPDLTSALARLLVEAADEERRRIGRNLHDGVQQRLVVLGHRIALAQRRLETAPEEAAEHLRHAAEETSAAGEELRELARGLHPAGLAEYGLEPALCALSQRSPLELRVVELPDRRLPEVV